MNAWEKLMLNKLYGRSTDQLARNSDMFTTQVAVSEKRYLGVARLEAIHAATGKEFPVSGDAKLRMEHQLLKARMEAARLLVDGDGIHTLEPPC